MKKILRALTLALAVMMACSVLGTALADQCFDLMKAEFTNPSSEYYLGSCTPAPGTENDYNMAIYGVESGTMVVATKNESIVIVNVGIDDGINCIVNICRNWDYWESKLGEGYTLVVGILIDDDNSIAIRSSEDAARFVAHMDGSSAE